MARSLSRAITVRATGPVLTAHPQTRDSARRAEAPIVVVIPRGGTMTTDPFPSGARRRRLRVATTSLAAAAAVGTGALAWSVTHATDSTSAVSADGTSSTSTGGTSTSGTGSSGPSSLSAGDTAQSDASSGGS
jgi:hypothetical protein